MKIPKIKYKTFKINNKIRLGILAVILILFIVSAVNIVSAYQQPTTKEKTYTVPLLTYSHSGQYDFQVKLKSNTLFESNTVLKPGEATIFKKLIDNINASFTYRFQSNKDATVEGTYKIEVTLQSDIWSKSFVLVPTTSFTGNEYTSITFEFPFNTSIYEQIVKTINDETGVIAQDPALILRCNILTTAVTEVKEIREVFVPTIQIPLGGNILEFNGELITKQPGSVEVEEVEVIKTDAGQQRNNWTIFTIFSLIFFVFFALFTKSETSAESPADVLFRKIQKKYGDWIVEAETLPPTGETKTISMKSFDDLIKISEEIGKPVVHYKTTTANPGIMHTFYVFDDDIHYKHILPHGEKITKIARCPGCGEKIKCEGEIGETIRVRCPICDNRGKIILTKTKNVFTKLFSSRITTK